MDQREICKKVYEIPAKLDLIRGTCRREARGFLQTAKAVQTLYEK